MAITLGCLAILLIAFLYREHDRKQERHEWREERRELLNRIKPETAVHGPVTLETVPAVQVEGEGADEDYWNNRKKVTNGVAG